MSSLKGKVALVTGAASGLGQAAAQLLVQKGSHVIYADLAKINSPNSVILDVTQEKQWQNVINSLSDEFGGIDILVNAAGISLAGDDLQNCTPESWSRTMAVNLDGTFLGCKYILPAMRERGGGSIINFGSINSHVGDGNAIAYVASKGGVRLLTKSIALYCAQSASNIRCNLVCPGYIETTMLNNWLAQQPFNTRNRLENAVPMKRLGQPAEVASLVAYLASDEAASVTGSEFAVDGGFLAQ